MTHTTKKVQKVNDLLRLAMSKAGCVHEAVNAARRAQVIAHDYDLPPLLRARCANALYKAERRLEVSAL
jgi:hypothetical protein